MAIHGFSDISIVFTFVAFVVNDYGTVSSMSLFFKIIFICVVSPLIVSAHKILN